MKRVVLYNPRAHFFDMPLALLAIASGLDPERFEVEIIDARLESDPHARLVAAARGAVCVGMTVLTGRPIVDALEAAERVRAVHPEVPIVWGGWHASLFPTAVLEEESAVDITVQGQGEETFRVLVDHLAEGAPLDGLEGISYRREGVPIKNPPRAMVDLNALPPVRYDWIDCRRYFEKKGRRQLDFISSTGCLFRCTFCADPHVYQRRFTQLSPDRLVATLRTLQAQTGFEDLNFQDETFFTYPKDALEMAKGLMDAGVRTTWAATLRADQCHRMSDSDLALLRRSGLRRVLMGVESGSQEMMDRLKKDIRMSHVLEGAARCKQLGIS
ncbi:MAG: radical SAM protein, partial [Myxococcota bacterium]|nr:radical SAM protein [Myxococcota bacterium]